MSALGSWQMKMSTPMGEQTGVLAVVETDGVLAATLTGPDGEAQPATDFKADGTKLTWKIAMKKPMPMTLHFDVTVDGDAFSGKFRPGMFPPSPVSAVRI